MNKPIIDKCIKIRIEKKAKMVYINKKHDEIMKKMKINFSDFVNESLKSAFGE